MGVPSTTPDTAGAALGEDELTAAVGVAAGADRESRPRLHAAVGGWPLAGVASGAAFLALALLAYWPVQPFSTGEVVNCGCYDVAEQMWFLSWTPHAIAHGLNPFFTSALNAPYGANLAANTTMPLLGLIASPISLTLGPVATYNVLIRLALATSALSMCLVLRHYGVRWAVAALGGLLFGFSPFMLAQGGLHLNLCFVALLPPIVVALDELLVRPRHSPRRAGLTLGALVTAQYFVSSELLADLVVLSLIGLLVLAASRPHLAAARGRRAVTGLGWALTPFVVLAGYPIIFAIVGPQHVVGSHFDPASIDIYRDDLLSPIVPTPAQLLSPSGWAALGASFAGGGTENGGYLGLPLVAAVFVTAAWAARRRVWPPLLFAAMALVAFVLALGPSLEVHRHQTGVWLPFRVLSELPGLDFSVPARFSLFVDLAVVLALAPAFDALVGWIGKLRSPATATATGAALCVVAFLPLLPAAAEASAPTRDPAYFTGGAVTAIAPHATVLTYPYPQLQQDQAQLWQVAAGFRFRLIGGYVLTPYRPAGEGGGFAPRTLEPSTVPQVLFEAAYASSAAPTQIAIQPWSLGQLRTFIDRYRVDDIVVARLGADPGYISRFVTAAVGARPVRSGGVEVWYAVRRRPLVRAAATG